MKSNFFNKVDQLCNLIDTPHITVKKCGILTKTLEDAAKQTLPNAINTVECRIWDNYEILKNLCSKRDSLDRNVNKIEHKEYTNQIQKRFDQLRNNFYQCEANKVSDVYEARNLEKLYRLSKQNLLNKSKRNPMCRS